MTMIRRYSELRHIKTFDERFEYLVLDGSVGVATFGYDRFMNQEFYHSREWKDARQEVIFRDNGCDLGIPGYEITTELYVHHINPMTPEDLHNQEEWVIDPEYLIVVSNSTHNAIHFGDRSQLRRPYTPRSPGDTRLW